MNIWLKENQETFEDKEIKNSEDMALSRIGKQLYEKLIKDYTYKQWDKYPNELDKSVLSRIPIRNNFDSRYFSDKYQALPHKGYTHFIKQLITNDLIEYKLNTDFEYFRETNDLTQFKKLYILVLLTDILIILICQN
jgi:UDP-galactopyranose mutase